MTLLANLFTDHDFRLNILAHKNSGLLNERLSVNSSQLEIYNQSIVSFAPQSSSAFLTTCQCQPIPQSVDSTSTTTMMTIIKRKSPSGLPCKIKCYPLIDRTVPVSESESLGWTMRKRWMACQRGK